MFEAVGIKSVKEKIGVLVKALRSRDGLTQEQLAEQLNVSRITIQNLEAGKNPTIDTVLKVLQHFDLLAGFDNYIGGEIDNNSHESLY